MRADLVGHLAAAPVFGRHEFTADARDDGLDLRVQVRDLLLARVGRDDVDQFVPSWSAHDSPSGRCGRPGCRRALTANRAVRHTATTLRLRSGGWQGADQL